MDLTDPQFAPDPVSAALRSILRGILAVLGTWRIELMLVRYQTGTLQQGAQRVVTAPRAQAAGYRSQLGYLIRTASDMIALLDSSAQARRVLRPLCRALAMELSGRAEPQSNPELAASRWIAALRLQ